MLRARLGAPYSSSEVFVEPMLSMEYPTVAFSTIARDQAIGVRDPG